jgi:phosphoglycerate dehydrogenase-like enzyme
MTRTIIERLPNLRLIASTGPGNASIALAAAAERGLLWTPGIWIVAHLNNNVIPMSTQ